MNRYVRFARRATALVVVAIVLGACNIDWSDTFGSSGGNGTSNASNSGLGLGQTDVSGFNLGISSTGFDDTFNGVSSALSGQTEQTQVVDFNTVDDTNTTTGDDATAIDDDSIGASRVILFDNPTRNIPLIQSDPRTALDLPPRIFVYADADADADASDRGNDVGVAYNNTEYLARRYDLEGAGDSLDAMSQNLETLTVDATGGNELTRVGGVAGISRGQGIESATSDNDFDTTLARLNDAIDARSDLARVETIDNRAIAARYGYSLDPNTVVLVADHGNEIPLLGDRQTIGIDLPQKILVSEAGDGTVTVYYNDPRYIADRHDVSGHADQIDALAEVLDALVEQATNRDQ